MPKVSVIGRRFGRLIAQERLERDRLRCLCDCGGTIVASRGNLSGGRTTSCGCARKEWVEKNESRFRWPEYAVWQAMKTRCSSPRHRQWMDYGGRGIRVCARWRESFDNFIADVGRRPSPELTIDRIDNDGNYEPGNCRWVTRKAQTANRRISAPKLLVG